jgi:DNA repair photolyase
MGLSPGLDFETQIFSKPNAAELLTKALSKPGYRPERIHVGANTDPYQPLEKTQKITRHVLEVLDAFSHPVSIITKSALVVRDMDILSRMASRGLVKVYISVTTLDRSLARAMEPRAATPARRLWTLQQLASAGIRTGVGFAPAIPGLNDHEMEAVLAAAAQAGAREAMYVALRLPREIKDLFYEWLDASRPQQAMKIRSLIRQIRGGRDYDAVWGSRMRGEGPVAKMLSQRFTLACARLGLNRDRMTQRQDLFRVPAGGTEQLDLFATVRN